MKNQAYHYPFRKIGEDVVIWPKAKIVSPEVISLGDSVLIDDFVLLMGGRDTSIGSFVHIASFTSISGGGALVMEDFSGLSSGVRIFTGNEDYDGGGLTNPTVPAPYRMPIRSFVHLRKHTLIGSNSVILPGVTINEGAAIGANSLVTRDCEPWTIYAGTPSRPLRPRKKEEILLMEKKLRADLYNSEGIYIPKYQRNKGI